MILYYFIFKANGRLCFIHFMDIPCEFVYVFMEVVILIASQK